MPKKTWTLDPAEQNDLSLASGKGIETAFQNLYPYLKSGDWIGPNVYRSDTIGTLAAHVAGNTVSSPDLAAYIAASIPGHCLDGWSYLGRALACLVSGDIYTARHLGYYAELRAALSLLASAGIGVFDGDHFVVDSIGACQRVSGGKRTHVFAWLALDHWTMQPTATELVGRVIQPFGIPLADWVREFMGGTGGGFAYAHWLRAFGMDLQVFEQDREARNAVSYLPSRFCCPSSPDPIGSLNFVQGLWELNAPLQHSRFGDLDRYLLRRSLQQIVSAMKINQNDYRARVERMISKLNIVDDVKTQQLLEDFFTDKAGGGDPLMLLEADKRSPITDPRYHLQLLARAALLLRIATGSSAKLIADTLLTAADLESLWKPIGNEFGLWEPNDAPDSSPGEITVLWDEVAVALERLDLWAAETLQPNYATLRMNQSYPLEVLTSCERIALWGLIP
jgi:hypothetical protein